MCTALRLRETALLLHARPRGWVQTPGVLEQMNRPAALMPSKALETFEHAIQDAVDLLNHFDR